MSKPRGASARSAPSPSSRATPRSGGTRSRHRCGFGMRARRRKARTSRRRRMPSACARQCGGRAAHRRGAWLSARALARGRSSRPPAARRRRRARRLALVGALAGPSLARASPLSPLRRRAARFSARARCARRLRLRAPVAASRPRGAAPRARARSSARSPSPLRRPPRPSPASLRFLPRRRSVAWFGPDAAYALRGRVVRVHACMVAQVLSPASSAALTVDAL